MAAPYGVGTVVTHQAKDAQGNNVGAPYDAVWKESGVVEFYYPDPPPIDSYKKVTGVWNEAHSPPCVITENFEYVYSPGANFSARQGTIETSHGSATAVG